MCASTSVVSTPGKWRCTLAIALYDHPPSQVHELDLKI